MSWAIGLIVGTGLVTAVFLAVLAVIAHRFTTPRRQPSASTVPRSPRGCQNISLQARVDGVRLAAWYAPVPDAIGAVVFVHGRDAWRGDVLRGELAPLLDAFHQRQLNVLMIDLRGHGESAAARLTFGSHESRDVLAAIDYLKQCGFSLASIGLLGASMGGAAAIVAAAQEPRLGAVVTDSTYADLHHVLRLQFRRLTRLPPCFLSGALLAARVLTGVSMLQSAPAVHIAGRRGQATLVIHAADDPFVPVSHAHALAASAECQLWITAGRKHLSSYGVEGRVYLETVATFFSRHLQAPVACATMREDCARRPEPPVACATLRDDFVRRPEPQVSMS